VPNPSWVEDGEALLGTIVEYVEETGRRVGRGETFGYGYWIVRFEASSSGRLAWRRHPRSCWFLALAGDEPQSDCGVGGLP